jgi:N-acetylglucosamine-6-phosphate deacetylase
VDGKGAYAVPGLVDVHTHGRAGYDFTYAEGDQLREMAKSYLSTGVTTVMPTFASETHEVLCQAADRVNAVKGSTGGAKFAGLHLEGRYINPEKRGAHNPDLLVKPDAAELKTFLERAGLPCHISYAPELDTDNSFADVANAAGATRGIAHTSASYEEAMKAVEGGVVSFTHLYNAMPALHHRKGGTICAGFLSDAYAELIVDGIHIAPEMVKLAYTLKGSDRLVLITDSMEASGCPDGEYQIAGQPVTVKNQIALTHDGALAGSTLNLFNGVKNLMKFAGISLEDAIACATINPARQVKIDAEVGSLEAGKYADILLLNECDGEYSIGRIVCSGAFVE